MSKLIFVFGSNLAGRHGAGAAADALADWGAVYGNPQGPQGRSYAIPTKDRDLKTLDLDVIRRYIVAFNYYAHGRIQFGEYFFVTRIGCGLAGYKDNQIAPMFKDSPLNCHFSMAWIPYIRGPML